MATPHLERFAELYESGARFVVFDVETVGASDGQFVVEIGAVEAGRSVAKEPRSFQKILQFKPASWRPYWAALKVHGIPTAEIERGAPRTQTLAAFLEFVQGATLICHTAFDIRAMRLELDREHALAAHRTSPLWDDYLDSCSIARRAWPELKSHKLGALSEHLQIQNPAAHRALADAMTTKKMLARALGVYLASQR
jgi:DNA polymerase-3 subunit epsilon